ncbi:MAG: Pycsar system effector family protein [Bacteroidota bacterium]
MQSPILNAAQSYVLNFFNSKQDARYVYHNYQLTVAVVTEIELLAATEEVTDQQTEVALLAAWFYNIGYWIDYQDQLYYSQLEAEKFLLTQEYPSGQIKEVRACLKSITKNSADESLSQQLFRDGFIIVTQLKEQEEKQALHRLELELVLGEKIKRKDWNKGLLDNLMRLKLYTHTAKVQFQNQVSVLIKTLREQEVKSQLNEDEIPNFRTGRRFANLEKKVPDRGNQTFFRSNYRNHINLSAIADNKANIMISVNSILISVLITALTYRNITESQPMILLPVVIFLVTGLASLIFAVLSARPKVTSLNADQKSIQEVKKNIIFFGNFVSLDLDDYEVAMDEMLNDSELLYGNMTRDLYYLGKVLDKKYRYLTVSYNIFMLGFIATVLTFLITFLFS